MALVAIKNKYQIVIPAKLRKAAGLSVGDFLDANFENEKLTFVPQAVIDRKHLAKLPKGIREGLEDVYAGRMSGPFTHDEFVRHFESVVRRKGRS